MGPSELSAGFSAGWPSSDTGSNDAVVPWILIPHEGHSRSSGLMGAEHPGQSAIVVLTLSVVR